MAGYIGNFPTPVPLTGADLTDGIITSAKIADGTIVGADINSTFDLTGKTVTGAGGGKVLQVVQGSTSTSTTNNTTSYTDTTLSASITPSSTSSKILVMLTQKLFIALGTSDRGSIKAKLVRGATDIWENATIYFQTTGISGEIDRYVCVNYLDTPSTTSSTTYKTQFAIDSTATNKIAFSQYDSNLSYITLMEIAG
jgi:hypothetical protein